MSTTAAIVGFVSLASAMGIGRFAFTPMLPMMQDHAGVTLEQGGWLASANYAGYFVGALVLSAIELSPRRLTQLGLAAVAMSTLAMALTDSFTAWLALRFLAGVASACVLIGTSGWALAMLTRAGREHGSGFVFAGVGTGIMLAGLVVLVAGFVGATPAQSWLVLGAIALAALVATLSIPDAPELTTLASAAMQRPPTAQVVRLAMCYGAFGFGYILPATFLPALARQAMPEEMFGWVWPVFGAVATASALIAGRMLKRYSALGVWTASHVIMAAGVIAPAIDGGWVALLISAIAVGGTFVVATVAGVEHARAVAGAAAPRLIATMTSAFALGQWVGPMTLSTGGSFRAPSLIAALLLVVSAAVLFVSRPAR
ncbi:MAG TPA: YbfB/YjiJ family MFS transporter [Casimicrobiaceae bacterium]|nr:YbfB/YjiJ family MFS transporter [Casimicrobiaceae bacterium]